ncbi:MAG: hypothetical protein ACTSUT_14295, partial [Promethearchaeota archaeon]
KVRFKDDRIVDAEIRKATISKNKSGQYFASILFKANIQTEEPEVNISISWIFFSSIFGNRTDF